MRLVTNEEFETALNNTEYKRIMSKASKGISKNMSQDDIKSCRLDALWLALAKYDPTKSKFETFLYNYTRWSILKRKEGKKGLPGTVTITDLGYDITENQAEEEEPVSDNIDVTDILTTLNQEDSKLMTEYYLEGNSMTTMAQSRKCTRQCIHQKMKRVVKKLRAQFA